jgi:hypothetical protein
MSGRSITTHSANRRRQRKGEGHSLISCWHFSLVRAARDQNPRQRRQGYEVDQIANDIGMSRQNVEHYMRFRDQMKVGADGQKRLRLVNRED